MSMQIVAQRDEDVSGLGESRKELTALVAGCGIYRPERALLSLTGRDRVRWLNGMVSNNIRDLAVGSGVYAFILTAQGHIQADMYAFNARESLLVETEKSQAETVLRIFRKYIIMDKVEIEEHLGKPRCSPSPDRNPPTLWHRLDSQCPGSAAISGSKLDWSNRNRCSWR